MQIIKTRNTLKKEKIIKIFKRAEKPMSSQEIYCILKKTIDINLSTVYRALNTLVKTNFITKELRQNGITYYEINDHIHKHYLVCNKCNSVLKLKECPIDNLAMEISKKTGYTITDHELEFRGICPNCINK
ncbi:MAG: transcriptional repressor [Clostridia bacterium]